MSERFVVREEKKVPFHYKAQVRPKGWLSPFAPPIVVVPHMESPGHDKSTIAMLHNVSLKEARDLNVLIGHMNPSDREGINAKIKDFIENPLNGIRKHPRNDPLDENWTLEG